MPVFFSKPNPSSQPRGAQPFIGAANGFLSSSVGFIVEQTGWFWFFIVCFALALPGMLMLPKIAPWNERVA